MTAQVMVAASTPGSGAWTQGHLLHLVAAIAFFVLALGGVALSERPARADRPLTVPLVRTRLLDTVAAAVAGAALVHFAVAPEHFRESWLLGAFFLVSGTGQLAFAALLVRRPTRPLLVAGVVANLAVVLLWLYTRTVAVPFGIGAAGAEPFGLLDILASSLESVAVVGGGLLLSRSRHTSKQVAAPLP